MGNSSETQDKILETAIRHFAKKGYHGTKTADIAKDSGVSEGLVFKYYNTKKDILRGVMDKIAYSIIPNMMLGSAEELQSLMQSENSIQEIKAFVKVRIEKANQNIDAFKILLNELQYHEDIMDELREHFIPKIIGAIESFFEIGTAKGIFRQINPHIAARSLMGMINMIVLEGNILKKPIELDKELDMVLDILMNGICVRKEG
jgi:AcrR family transcriptional regulator